MRVGRELLDGITVFAPDPRRVVVSCHPFAARDALPLTFGRRVPQALQCVDQFAQGGSLGAAHSSSPLGMATGTPISPGTGYTLPSAGAPVTLHDGSPLYKDGTECYSPMMRCTSCQIDQAGNVWAVNNWKPRFRTAFEPNEGNPGGDGVVIFVGLAKPPALPSWIQPGA